MDQSFSSEPTQHSHWALESDFNIQLRPKLLFMGPRSGGKSSIRHVVFHKLEPDQTLHLESTRKITQDDIQSFIDFEIWDLPGPLESDLFAMPFQYVGAVIFVIDAQSNYLSTVPRLASTLIQAYQTNPALQFQIFMHKIDAVTPDYRNEIIEQIKDRLTDELSDQELTIYGAATNAAEQLSHKIRYKLTSVFDYSIYDALSRVIMNIIPQQAALEQLMTVLATESKLENCILFDTWTKLYIATDSSPMDEVRLEMCCEFMDIFTDLSELYGVPHKISPVTRPSTTAQGTLNGRARPGRAAQSDGLQSLRSPSRGRTRDTSLSVRNTSAFSGSSPAASISAPHGSTSRGPAAAQPSGRGRRMTTSHVKVDSPVDLHRWASAIGQPELANVEQAGRVISYYEINPFLTLVCITNEIVMREQSTLIEYNVTRVRESIEKIFQINNPAYYSSSSSPPPLSSTTRRNVS